MNEDDSEPAKSAHNSSNCKNIIPEKTCAEPMDDDTTNKSSIVVYLNKSNDSAIENDDQNRADSSLNSTVNSKPSTSGKSKRRSGAKKHRAGRNRKRKWKPYYKLNWQEKQKVEEREARRAQRNRDRLSAEGLPLAPYNTSQFLIDDYMSCHVIKTPNYEDIDELFEDNHSEEPSEEYYRPWFNQGAFYKQAFLEDYELCHQEYLDSLSHHKLAEEWVNLEDKIEAIDKQLKELQEQKRQLEIDMAHPEAEMEKITVFKIEIKKLFQENKDLEVQNEKLRRQLNLVS